MAGSGANGGGAPGAFGGQSQIIDGQSYQMYTPAWYDAQNAAKIKAAKVEGTATGTAAGAADAAKYETKYPGYQTPAPPTTSSNNFSSILAGLTGGSGSSGTGSGFPSVLGSGVGSATSSTPTGTSAASAYPQLAPVDTSAATAASFNRAKDQVGETSRGALTGLAGAMAGRGIVGSGVEGRGQASAVNAGQQQLGDVSRQNAITTADEAQKNAETNYQGGIAMRGQDISHGDTYNSQLLTQRGQDITASGQAQAAKQAQAELALKALLAQNAQYSVVY